MIFTRLKTNYDYYLHKAFRSAKQKVGFLIYCWLGSSALTQEELGKKVKMKQSAISRIANGQVSPSIETLRPELVFLQSTGLRDKNGELIFEGDIMITKQEGNFYKDVIHTIDWHKGICGFVWSELPPSKSWNPLGTSFAENWEIIGNIYEHLELLNNPL